MAGHIQETKQGVVKKLDALKTKKHTSTGAESPLRAQALKRESNGDLLTDKNSKWICIYPLKGLLD